jgi:hypothetical protein
MTNPLHREGDRAAFDWDEIQRKLKSGEWVCVPKTPTQRMLDAAWAAAHEEDAEEVWREMVDNCHPIKIGNSD